MNYKVTEFKQKEAKLVINYVMVEICANHNVNVEKNIMKIAYKCFHEINHFKLKSTLLIQIILFMSFGELPFHLSSKYERVW